MDRYSEFVEPIYLQLIGQYILSSDIDEQKHFKERVGIVLANTTDFDLQKLLCDDNWRASLVGAWLIFIKNKTEFTNEIGRFLLQGKGGTVGYCYALAKFGTKECSDCLIKYLEKELYFDKFPKETFQDIALSALLYIDKVNDTDISRQFTAPEGLWTKFVQFDFGGRRKLADYPRWGDIDENFKQFELMFDFINSIGKEY